MMQIELRQGSALPLYQQLVDAISADIRSDRLSAGAKLPTVRELADEMSLARGTIKHAYDELGKLGLIEMTQGRGTFVLARNEQGFTGKKERAMKAIDCLLDEMESLAFTAREIQIFIELKLREREERYDNVRIALVDCNPEALSLISNQLSHLPNIDVYKFLLHDILQSPHKLGGNADLIITTSTHFSEVENVASSYGKVARMVLTPTPNTLMELAKIPPEDKIGIFCASERFANIIRKSCFTLEGRPKPQVRLFGQAGDTAAFLAGCQTVIIPPGYSQFCSQDEGAALRRAKGEGKRVIQYGYQIDGGSFLYLEEEIERVRKAKKGG